MTKDSLPTGDIDFENMTIQQARKYAALYRVPVPSTATKDEIIQSIKTRLKDKRMAVVAETGTRPKPGWARIIVHRDATPRAANRPVYVHCNGYRCTVPRGVEVDVPMRVVRTLNDAVETRLVEDPSVPSNDPKRFTYQNSPSYPFQVIDQTPGPEVPTALEKNKIASEGPRTRFKDMFGRWPKRQELYEAMKEGFIKLDPAENMESKEFKD